MYTRFSGMKFFLLNIVTCGIYSIYAWFKMTENLNKMAAQEGEPQIAGFIVAWLLGGVTCGIYSLIWIFKFFGLAAKLSDKSNAGVTPNSPFVMFIMSIIPIYSFFWMAEMNNKLVDAYEGK